MYTDVALSSEKLVAGLLDLMGGDQYKPLLSANQAEALVSEPSFSCAAGYQKVPDVKGCGVFFFYFLNVFRTKINVLDFCVKYSLAHTDTDKHALMHPHTHTYTCTRTHLRPFTPCHDFPRPG